MNENHGALAGTKWRYWVIGYFGLLLSVVGYYSYNGYAYVRGEEQNLALANEAVVKLDAYLSQSIENLKGRIAQFENLASDESTLKQLKLRQIEIVGEINRAAAKRDDDVNTALRLERYRKVIDKEALTQESTYLSWRLQLVEESNKLDALRQENPKLLEQYQKANERLLSNDAERERTSLSSPIKSYSIYRKNFKIKDEYQQASIEYQANLAALTQAQDSIGVLTRPVVDEAKFQSQLARLYSEVSQHKENIKRHWINNALQPGWFDVPLWVWCFITFLAVVSLAHFVFQVLDRGAAKSNNKSAYVSKMLVALVLLIAVPVMLNLLNSAYAKAQQEATTESIKAMIERAEGQEMMAIEQHASELERFILALQENRKGIKDFSGEMLALGAMWDSVFDKEKFRSRAIDGFNKHVISKADFDSKRAITLTLFQKDIELIENKLLVDARVTLNASELGSSELTGGALTDAVGRISETSQRGDWAIVGTTIVLLPYRFFFGLVADVAVYKGTETVIEDKVRFEIKMLSSDMKKRFTEESQNLIRLRNAELKKQLGVSS